MLTASTPRLLVSPFKPAEREPAEVLSFSVLTAGRIGSSLPTRWVSAYGRGFSPTWMYEWLNSNRPIHCKVSSTATWMRNLAASKIPPTMLVHGWLRRALSPAARRQKSRTNEV